MEGANLTSQCYNRCSFDRPGLFFKFWVAARAIGADQLLFTFYMVIFLYGQFLYVTKFTRFKIHTVQNLFCTKFIRSIFICYNFYTVTKESSLSSLHCLFYSQAYYFIQIYSLPLLLDDRITVLLRKIKKKGLSLTAKIVEK
jgi:hypothetical protein